MESGLDRALALVDPDARSRAAGSEAGYLDLLGDTAPTSPGPAQRLMLSGFLPAIYERWWRPALARVAKGALGPSMAGELRIAQTLLSLAPGDGVLDVACGTGAFTRAFARSVGPLGLSVGIDVSATMLARAVAETRAAGLDGRVGYVRGDAAALPFRDGSFDAVCCFAALNLMAEPIRAIDRMVAVLAPGGRIGLFTSVRGRSLPLGVLDDAIGRASGMRIFGPDELSDALAERGMVDVRRRLTGVTQFVGARKPR